eukprot:SAG31_NODE_372_length_16598_cov_44.705982_9_plen_211_part_00
MPSWDFQIVRGTHCSRQDSLPCAKGSRCLPLKYVAIRMLRNLTYCCGCFHRSVNLTYCGGLAKHPQISSPQACKALCCADSACGVWEWCPDTPDLAGCAHWASSRCHTGPPNIKVCPWAAHWYGETKTVLPPPPPIPSPSPSPGPAPPAKRASTRKQGFSGFLGPYYSCDDAKALGLFDSWHVTFPAAGLLLFVGQHLLQYLNVAFSVVL